MNIRDVEFVLSAASPSQFIRDGRPQIAFAGRSNVGKSSLLNRLLQRKKLARTSSKPGRTRMINYFLVNKRFYFVDLPGYGYARASKVDRQGWGALIEKYLLDAGSDARLILLVDAKIEGSPLDEQAFGYFDGLGVEQLVVATKIDRVPRSKRSRTLQRIEERLDLQDGQDILPVSAETGEGIDQLWSRLSL